MDCGNKAEERHLEIRCLHRSLESQRSDCSKYLKDCEVQQIRMDCEKKTKELARARKVRRANTFVARKGSQEPKHVILKLQDLVDAAEKQRIQEKKPYNLVERFNKNTSPDMSLTLDKDATLLRYGKV